jgi:hypothetical protein
MRKDTGQTHWKKALTFEKGELIIKQGDYGMSIYKVLSGSVKIFRTYNGAEVPLATLEAGGVIGEMAFLNKDADVRSASARALEDSELEVWHPRELAEKYGQTSVVLKIIIDQALDRLLRINRYMDQLAAKRAEEVREPKEKVDPWSSTRRFYRKEVDIPCKYKPAKGAKGSSSPLKGRIKDISMSGMCLEISPGNELTTSHAVGESFHIDAILPNGDELNVTAEIVSVKRQRREVRLGMQYKELPDYYGAKKALGFFLMPT